MAVERSNARACEQRREQRWVRVMEASGDGGEVRKRTADGHPGY